MSQTAIDIIGILLASAVLAAMALGFWFYIIWKMTTTRKPNEHNKKTEEQAGAQAGQDSF